MASESEEDPLLRNGSPTVQSSSRSWRKWKVLAFFFLGIAAGAGLLALTSGLWVGRRKDATSESAVKTKSDGHRYRATQFISFTINTLGGLEAHGECKGRHVDPESGTCYLGNADNITEDVMHRLQIVEEVLDHLKADGFLESPDVDRSHDVLKVFLMPEFFLRGPIGAYSTSQILDDGVLIQVADRVRDLIAVEDFKDYLFVFGTIITARSPNDPSKPWDENTEADDVEYYNFAPVYRGGPSRKLHKIVTKKYISDADFLKRVRLPNPTSANIRGYSSIEDQLREKFESRDADIVEDNVIETDGIRIGIEICLDHRMGALWNSLKTKHDSKLVDVQLIVSAGMAIGRGPNPVVPRGVVYLSDGEASSAACMRTDTGRFDSDFVCREDIAGLKHIPVGGPGYSDFFPLAACIDLEASTLLKGYYSLYQKQGCAYTLKLYGIDVFDDFKYYPPSIEIYPTVALPGFN